MPYQADKAANSHRFLPILAILTAVNLIFFAIGFLRNLASRDGFLIDSVSPFGGDFINLWTTGKLLVAGAVGTIYDPSAFMAFQNGFVHANIGHRLWAYPPQSLLLAWPFGFFGYFTSFTVWSVFGLAFLVCCARRFGFDWKEVFVLVLSPAALTCITAGQTGNFFTGLMLLALVPRSRTDPYSILGAALLTIKPQTGFLLPLVWGFQRRWLVMILTAVAALAVLAASVLLFGTQSWSDYLYLTAPELSKLERFGTGPFTRMIPSIFMSLRLLGMSGDSALAVHLVFACVVAIALAWRLSRTADHRIQSALVLVATCLITPYIHVYDLSLLLAGGLLILRTEPARSGGRLYLTAGAVFITWLTPSLMPMLADGGIPLMPLLLLIVFFTIREPAPAAREIPPVTIS
ncbi:MAG: glycosyltransferase family 87 protein [Mesorhizobium sp.]